jgi:hypothetical protein
MRARAWLFLWLMTAALGWAQPAIEFTGVLAAGAETKVLLVDKATGQSRWVRLGQEFAGHTAATYDPRAETIVLTKAGQQFRLKLKDSKVKSGGSAADPSPEIKRAILNNLRQLAAAADQYYLENGKTQVTLDELVGETKYVRKLVVIDGENYGSIVFAQGKPLTVTTAGGYTTTYDP